MFATFDFTTSKFMVRQSCNIVPQSLALQSRQTGGASPRRAEDHLKNPSDNVWFARFYKQQVYTVEQAFTMHRETHHPTQLDLPDALLHTEVELDMSTDKTV
ncbi:hypothetical protein E2C01_024081 [Portunus trituberculatus]|uniref:Uncharacterized protein n=1 Tax=Portunus trituberculatus TaxID=210409 RepID=A0A5B7E9Q5_PORTR|nr:hypothetical protein [Portunus trituberculatus]